jgi:hypothetical protein
MAVYTMIPSSQGEGFDVHIVAVNGASQTMLGFDTEADAAAWIADDRRLDSCWGRTRWGVP